MSTTPKQSVRREKTKVMATMQMVRKRWEHTREF